MLSLPFPRHLLPRFPPYLLNVMPVWLYVLVVVLVVLFLQFCKYLISVTKGYLENIANALSPKKWTLYFVLALFDVLYLLSLSFVTTKRWSDAASASRFALTSSIVLLNFLLIPMWSIWFSVTWSGDIQIISCSCLCGNCEPPMTMLLSTQKSANISPFLFIWPSPC